MPTCPHCGKEVAFWGRDFFTGACPRCREAGARPATIDSGTLLMIVMAAAIIIRPSLNVSESRVSEMRSAVQDLKKALNYQAGEIRELRKDVDKLRKGAAGPSK